MNFAEKFSMSKFASKTDRDLAIEVDWQFMNEELARVRAELKTVSRRHAALSEAVTKPLAETVQENMVHTERLQGLRNLCGYVENGTDTVIRIFQDDATNDWVLKVGDARLLEYCSPSFIGVIDAAVADIKININY